MVEKLGKDIQFHVDTLKKSKVLTLEIISDLKAREIETAIVKIQNRERLLKIVFQMYEAIEKIFSKNNQNDPLVVGLGETWHRDVKIWSKELASLNTEIENSLSNEKDSVVREIALVYDKKSRHKGYDLTSLK